MTKQETLNFGNKEKFTTWRIDFQLKKAFQVSANKKEKFSILPNVREYLATIDYGAFKEEDTDIISFMPKCEFHMCFHHGEHEEGSCMHITQPDLANMNTMKKFCPCTVNLGENLRRYEHVGFMEPGSDDTMITKPCAECGIDLLINVNSEVCIGCEHKGVYM